MSFQRRDAPRLRVLAGGAPAEWAERPTPVRDDSELLAAVRAGDPGAATAFHDRVRPQIDRTLRRLLGPRDADHQDLAQNALIELVSTIERYRGECALDSWVATLTSRLVYKQFRRRKLERQLFTGLAEQHLEVVGGRTERALLARSVLARLAEHIGAMDATRAGAYVLHDVCGHDLREVAEIMGVSVAAAQSRLVRGRKELHERIQSDPELAAALDREEVP